MRDELKTQFPDVPESDIDEELDVAEKYNCFVPPLARWKYLLNPCDEDGEQISYGDAITIALAEVEKSNSALLSGVLSNTRFNKINAKGERAIDDATLRRRTYSYRV